RSARNSRICSGVASCPSRNTTGSPTYWNSRKAMAATLTITTTAWTSRRRMKASMCQRWIGAAFPPAARPLWFGRGSVYLDQPTVQPVVGTVHHVHVFLHGPRNHLVVQRNVGHILVLQLQCLGQQRGAQLQVGFLLGAL